MYLYLKIPMAMLTLFVALKASRVDAEGEMAANFRCILLGRKNEL